MPKAYFVSIYRAIRDPAKLAAYSTLAGPAIAAAGGRAIVRGYPADVHEGGLKERTVIIEFDSLAAALAVYETPAYKAALEALGDAVDRDIRVIEGLS